MVYVEDIHSVRKRLGLSQEKLAEALGVSRNTISRWERGESGPNADKMAALERLLAKHDAPAAPEATPAPQDTPAAPEAQPAPQETPTPTETPTPMQAPIPTQTPVSMHTPALREQAVPPPTVPTKPKRWPVALMCAGVACALLIGIAALVGVYSIRQEMAPDNIVPAEEIEREEVDGVLILPPATLQPLQP